MLWITLVVFVLATVGLVAADAWILLADFSSPIFGWQATQTAFVVNCVLIVVAMLVIGFADKGHPLAIIIDSRNRYTISKLQAAVWSVLLLAGLMAAALANLLRSSQGDPFDLSVPQEIFLAAGISLTSLAATPLIHSVKTRQQTSTIPFGQARTELRDPEARMIGRIYIASSPAKTT